MTPARDGSLIPCAHSLHNGVSLPCAQGPTLGIHPLLSCAHSPVQTAPQATTSPEFKAIQAPSPFDLDQRARGDTQQMGSAVSCPYCGMSPKPGNPVSKCDPRGLGSDGEGTDQTCLRAVGLRSRTSHRQTPEQVYGCVSQSRRKDAGNSPTPDWSLRKSKGSSLAEQKAGESGLGEPSLPSVRTMATEHRGFLAGVLHTECSTGVLHRGCSTQGALHVVLGRRCSI